MRALTQCRGSLLLGSHNRRGGEADPACDSDMVVVGSYDLLAFLTRPSERPGHATTTAAIRSKPIAPGVRDVTPGLRIVRQTIGKRNGRATIALNPDRHWSSAFSV
jgi:hypothetical protein